MEERQVTTDGVSMPLERPFLVVATQNPIELEGTFPFPEAPLDGFLFQINLGYPTASEEEDILRRLTDRSAAPGVDPILTANDVFWPADLASGLSHVFAATDYPSSRGDQDHPNH